MQHQELVVELVGLYSNILISDHELLCKTEHHAIDVVPVILSCLGGLLSCCLSREQLDETCQVATQVAGCSNFLAPSVIPAVDQSGSHGDQSGNPAGALSLTPALLRSPPARAA